MINLSKRYIFLITIFLMSALFTAPGFAFPISEASPRTVTVTGEGTVSTEPNIATVRIGVESFNRDIQEALAESRSKIKEIFDALVTLGVSERDMQTANYSFNFDRSSRSSSNSTPVYRVNNTLSVIIRNLALTGEIIDAAVLAGANEMWGVEFSLQNSAPTLNEATEKAVSDARERATYLAALNGLSVGKLLSINEGGTAAPMYSMERGLGGGVQPGVVSYTVRLTATFELIG